MKTFPIEVNFLLWEKFHFEFNRFDIKKISIKKFDGGVGEQKRAAFADKRPNSLVAAAVGSFLLPPPPPTTKFFWKISENLKMFRIQTRKVTPLSKFNFKFVLSSELGFPKKRAYHLLRLWLARLRLSGAFWKKTLAQRILVLKLQIFKNINFWKFWSVTPFSQQTTATRDNFFDCTSVGWNSQYKKTCHC